MINGLIRDMEYVQQLLAKMEMGAEGERLKELAVAQDRAANVRLSLERLAEQREKLRKASAPKFAIEKMN